MATDIDELRRLRASGTQGEWHAHLARWYSSVMVNSPDGPSEIASGELNKADASLICAAVNALPSLLDELARTRAELAAVRERLGMATHFRFTEGAVYYVINQQASDDKWCVMRWAKDGNPDPDVLSPSGEWTEQLNCASVGCCGGWFDTSDAAFAALAAARKETP